MCRNRREERHARHTRGWKHDGRPAYLCGVEFVEDNQMTVSLKRFKDCDCICHKGGVIVHVVACCDEYVPGQSKQEREEKRGESLPVVADQQTRPMRWHSL
jgi:hypothetical protein